MRAELLETAIIADVKNMFRDEQKVLIQSRDTIEVWYALPNAQRFANSNIWLPICNSIRSRPGRIEPEVYFRIVHTAQDSHNVDPVAPHREQTVEIALGPKEAFENGNIGTLTPRKPKTPRAQPSS